MRRWSFWLWLAALAVPVSVLISLQIDLSAGPSIGGGGYDLGPFIYSWLLMLTTGTWTVCTFIAALAYRDKEVGKKALILTAIGCLTFLIALQVYGRNLS
jgi:hypothetical protein